MGNQQGRELSDAEIGRPPNDNEMMVLYQLQQKLFTRLVQSPNHLALLKRLWDAHYINKQKAPTFERISSFWCTEGGFTTENPGIDLRSMGTLGLESLVYFVERFPGEAHMMKRAKGGYPFAKAAMAVGRAVCEVLSIVDEHGERGTFPVVRTLFWQIITTQESYHQLFALCFLLFEELYCEELATNSTLPVTERISSSMITLLVDRAKQQLMSTLRLAPKTLQDLSSICANAEHILADTTFVNSNALAPIQEGVWKQHQTDRKRMRDAAKDWSVVVAESDGPKTSTTPTSSSNSTIDLFEGLVTKHVDELTKQTLVARAS